MRILIIDDEPLPAKYLKELLVQHCSDVDSITILNNPLEGIEYLKKNDFDLIFLDVEMPKMNGIEFVKHARVKDSTSIVYTTAYENYALDAFKVNAVHYLVKPIEVDELLTAIDKVKKFQGFNKKDSESVNYSINLYDGDKYRLLEYEDIFWLKADGSYTKVYLVSESFLVTKRIGELEKELLAEGFMRCHNSHLINKNKIRGINKAKFTLILENGVEIPYSNSKRKEVYRLFEKP